MHIECEATVGCVAPDCKSGPIWLTTEQFDVNNPITWESDRASLFAKPGTKIWTGKNNEIATILEIKY